MEIFEINGDLVLGISGSTKIEFFIAVQRYFSLTRTLYSKFTKLFSSEFENSEILEFSIVDHSFDRYGNEKNPTYPNKEDAYGVQVITRKLDSHDLSSETINFCRPGSFYVPNPRGGKPFCFKKIEKISKSITSVEVFGRGIKETDNSDNQFKCSDGIFQEAGGELLGTAFFAACKSRDGINSMVLDSNFTAKNLENLENVDYACEN